MYLDIRVQDVYRFSIPAFWSYGQTHLAHETPSFHIKVILPARMLPYPNCYPYKAVCEIWRHLKFVMPPWPKMSTCHKNSILIGVQEEFYIHQSQSCNIHVEVCRYVAPVRYCVCFTTVECQPEPSLLNSLFSLSAKWGIVRPPMSKTSTQQHIFGGWGQAFTQCGHYWKVNYFVIQNQF